MSKQLKIGIKNGLYVFIAMLCFAVLKTFFRIRILGRENIDGNKGYIAVARHRSYWDPPVVTVAVGIFTPVHYISRKGLLRGVPIMQSIVRTFSTVIDRENFSRNDFRRVLAAMKQHRIIGLFPEGTTRESVDAKAGAIHFARLSGKQILPVNIMADGSYPSKNLFRLPRLTVSIGKPFSVAELETCEMDGQTRAQQSQAMSERLMLRVDNA